MSDTSIGGDQLELLAERLKEFRATLTDEQAELLDVILKLAWEVSSEDDTLAGEFSGTFKPAEAATLLAHSTGHSTVVLKMIRG